MATVTLVSYFSDVDTRDVAREYEYVERDVTGREARCYCGRTEPSSNSLAFYEYKGVGSDWAMNHCAHCGMVRVIHQAINPFTGRAGITDHEGVEREPNEFDSFYCGCRGWD